MDNNEQYANAPVQLPEHSCPYFDQNGSPRFSMPRPPAPKPSKTFMHHFGQGCLLLCLLMAVVCIFGFKSCVSLCKDSSGFLNELSKDNSYNEVTLRESESDDVIAVIDIKGIIANAPAATGIVSAPTIISLLDKLEKNDDIKALILDMDSPGGEVTASDEINMAIRRFKEKKKLPVITCMHSMGASGGYYIAAASDYIIANRSTFTGSIGVIMSSLNITELLKKIGVESEIYRSGDMKDMLNGTRPRTPQEIVYLNQLIQETFTTFAQVVADGRPTFFKSAADVMKAPFADGRVLSGSAAKEMGLVDELGYFTNAIEKASELAKLKSPQVIRYSPSLSWTSLLELNAGKLHPSAQDLLPVRTATMEAGKLYYLAPESLAK